VKHRRIPARHQYPLPSLDIQHNPHVERRNGWRLESMALRFGRLALSRVAAA
jgi:hypothetical protein